jgi:MerR family transcriptional regulator, copper efflux regulator
MSKSGALTIGALANGAGVGVETVRFYERKGLLPEPPRSASGYRQYPPDTVDRLRFIRRAQRLGFSLHEISDLLELRVDEVAACGVVEARAQAKLAEVAGKIAELRSIQAALLRLVSACEAREPTSDCPIMEEFEQAADPAT